MEANLIKKYAKKSLPALMDKAVEVFNTWIRERDRNGNYFTCISCGRTLRIEGGNYHAGHYYPSTVSAVRFNETNVNGQCLQCNYHKHGNLIEYRKNLIEKVGEDAVKELDLQVAIYKRQNFKWSRIDLVNIIEKYK